MQTKITKVIFLALIFNIILFLMEGKNMANDDKWKDKLNDEEYHVMRCGGTEPPFTGKYYKHNEKEVQKVESMDKKQLEEYIKSW